MGGGLGMIQAHYISCALYCYYCYISSTSDHQALELGGWGPLPYCIHSLVQLVSTALPPPWTSPLERAPMGQQHGGRVATWAQGQGVSCPALDAYGRVLGCCILKLCWAWRRSLELLSKASPQADGGLVLARGRGFGWRSDPGAGL